MSPRAPRDPQKGKAQEDVQAAEEAKASAEAEAVEKAEEAAEASEAPAPKKPRARARTRKAAEPEAAGAAAADTGVDKAAVAPARAAARARRKTRPAVLVMARAKYVRTSARKARLVCDHIRGKDVQEARAILAYTPRGVARDWSKLLESAIANAEHNHELVGEDLRIHSVVADEGPTLKRFRPRAMGRATRIRKRTSHLTITLTPKES
jgi:ribosomal protein L22